MPTKALYINRLHSDYDTNQPSKTEARFFVLKSDQTTERVSSTHTSSRHDAAQEWQIHCCIFTSRL